MREVIARAAATAATLAVLTGPIVADKQASVIPHGPADNIQFSMLSSGVIQVTYDLRSVDPSAEFSIALEASDDGGRTWSVRPSSVTGDVGQSVKAGPGKKILWEFGKDVETVRLDRFQFRVNATSRLPGAVKAPGTGGLRVTTKPDGAAVLVDGEPRGTTPLTIADLRVGDHRVLVRKAGFVDNQHVVQVRADAVPDLSVELTPLPGESQPTPARADHGKPLKWVLIAGGGGGAAAGILATKKNGSARPSLEGSRTLSSPYNVQIPMGNHTSSNNNPTCTYTLVYQGTMTMALQIANDSVTGTATLNGTKSNMVPSPCSDVTFDGTFFSGTDGPMPLSGIVGQGLTFDFRPALSSLFLPSHGFSVSVQDIFVFSGTLTPAGVVMGELTIQRREIGVGINDGLATVFLTLR